MNPIVAATALLVSLPASDRIVVRGVVVLKSA